MYCKNIDNAKNMQRMSIKIYKPNVRDTNISLSNFYAVSRLRYIVSTFYENYFLCPLLQKNKI